jgi:hypothetical protein
MPLQVLVVPLTSCQARQLDSFRRQFRSSCRVRLRTRLVRKPTGSAFGFSYPVPSGYLMIQWGDTKSKRADLLLATGVLR